MSEWDAAAARLADRAGSSSTVRSTEAGRAVQRSHRGHHRSAGRGALGRPGSRPRPPGSTSSWPRSSTRVADGRGAHATPTPWASARAAARAVHLRTVRSRSRATSARRRSRWARTSGHSAATIEKRAESRTVPSAPIRSARTTPSNRAPERLDGLAGLRGCARRCRGRRGAPPSVSKAWASINRLASTLMPVRWAERSQPRVADLDHVGRAVGAVERVVVGPAPVLGPGEPGAADHPVVGLADRGEGQAVAGAPPLDRVVHVGGHRRLGARHGVPPVGARVLGRGVDQGGDVLGSDRHEPDERAREGDGVEHVRSLVDRGRRRTLQVLAGGDPLDGAAARGVGVGLLDERAHVDDALALLARDLGPVVRVGRVGQVLVLLVLLVDRLDEVVRRGCPGCPRR